MYFSTKNTLKNYKKLPQQLSKQAQDELPTEHHHPTGRGKRKREGLCGDSRVLVADRAICLLHSTAMRTSSNHFSDMYKKKIHAVLLARSRG